ncbi:hypothetical protein [Kitasatospora acidiphila]|uniref:hypothetical protein n=1 Tax=Kitasatospora acidiphila TaxID=2567942 RepID=UPI001E44FF64|nr:hypothetical protein [Kitasatospora acidiphila]
MTASQTEAPAPWTEADDWTPEALALLRRLRAPHRVGRAKQVGFALYCVLLGLVIWGGMPSLGLFLQQRMGADYTGHGGQLLAALPTGVTAVALGTFLVVLRDAMWRGPVVPPRAAMDWLLAHPVRPRPVLRPWFWLSCALAAFPGLVAACGAMVALGLMDRVGLAAAFGWCLVGGLGVPLLATSAAVWVERSDRAAHWVRRLTPAAVLAVLGLAVQCGFAVAGHRVGWLERGELWSGPWGGPGSRRSGRPMRPCPVPGWRRRCWSAAPGRRWCWRTGRRRPSRCTDCGSAPGPPPACWPRCARSSCGPPGWPSAVPAGRGRGTGCGCRCRGRSG